LLFATVNLARLMPTVMRATSAKFKRGLDYVEAGAKKQGRNLSDLTLAEMDALWDEAKQRGV
jgi:uncharacterized protein YabN with tetrapyrrole methylase and pyrophosphatase domain